MYDDDVIAPWTWYLLEEVVSLTGYEYKSVLNRVLQSESLDWESIRYRLFLGRHNCLQCFATQLSAYW